VTWYYRNIILQRITSVVVLCTHIVLLLESLLCWWAELRTMLRHLNRRGLNGITWALLTVYNLQCIIRFPLTLMLSSVKTMASSRHRRLCRVKNMLAMYLKYHKAGLTPTTPVTSTAISPVNMSIGRKSLTNLRSEMIFLQGKPVFYIFLPSTPPYWQIILRFCWQWTPTWLQKGK
jgi:hypothetical protein